MAVDTTSSRSRRALLMAGLGAAAATTASALGRPQLAQANDPNDVRLGAVNTADTTTRINYNGAATAFRTASTSGIGVHGDSYNHSGVVGTSHADSGVFGTSVDSFGILGGSTKNIAVYGETQTGTAGVYGVAPDGAGVQGDSVSQMGVRGTTASADFPGVFGQGYTGVAGIGGNDFRKAPHNGNIGVYGYGPSRGVFGESASGTGVRGNSSAGGIGVHGDSPTGNAVVGNSASMAGVLGTSVSKTGVQGFTGSGAPPAPLGTTGVYGNAPDGRGGQFSGGKAQVRLVPSSTAGHPGSGSKGDLVLDSAGDLWLCKGTSAWVKLG